MTAKIRTPHGVEIREDAAFVYYSYERRTYTVRYEGAGGGPIVAQILRRDPEGESEVEFTAPYGADDLVGEDETVYVLAPITDDELNVPAQVALEIYRRLWPARQYELGGPEHREARLLKRALGLESMLRKWKRRIQIGPAPRLREPHLGLPEFYTEPDRLVLGIELFEAGVHPMRIRELLQPGTIL